MVVNMQEQRGRRVEQNKAKVHVKIKRSRRKMKILCVLMFGTGFFLAWTICFQYFSIKEQKVYAEQKEVTEQIRQMLLNEGEVGDVLLTSQDKNEVGQAETEDWMLMLVNSESWLDMNYEPELAEIENNYMVDERILSDLRDMLNAARADGLDPWICSSYRSYSRQQELFEKKCNTYINSGYSKERAEKLAATEVARPGTSEHATGLALDIVARSYQILDEKQKQTEEAIWFMEHCAEYGFILRYPEDKSEYTGVIFEPWHYRYVGKEAAKIIMEENLCLEEYLAKYR